VSERAQLPPCFQPKLLVCPHCLYIGSAAKEFRTGYCWACAKPIGRGEENVHVFGPEECSPSILRCLFPDAQSQHTYEDGER
jgi:hypothetical protein